MLLRQESKGFAEINIRLSSDRYVHAPLPLLGVRVDCYVTLAINPSLFWVQIKSPQLDDLMNITDLIQTTCEVEYVAMVTRIDLLPWFLWYMESREIRIMNIFISDVL